MDQEQAHTDRTVPPSWPRRKVFVASAAVVAGAAVVGVGALIVRAFEPAAQHDEPAYATTEDLEGLAQVIIRATLDSTREQTADGITETVAKVSIRGVAKGDVQPGSSLEIAYAPVDSGNPEVPDGLRKGGEFVLLLRRRRASTLWNLMNTTQGYYVIDGGRAVADPQNRVALSKDVLKRLDLS